MEREFNVKAKNENVEMSSTATSIDNLRYYSEINDCYNNMIDNEKVYLKELEISFSERQTILDNINALNDELLESIEVRNNNEIKDETRNRIAKLESELSVKGESIEELFNKLNIHYKECIGKYSIEIEEIEKLTQGSKPSPILKRRIKEDNKGIEYLVAKIGLLKKFKTNFTDNSTRDCLSEFNRFVKLLEITEIVKVKKREAMILVASTVTGFAALVLVIVAIIYFTAKPNDPSPIVPVPVVPDASINDMSGSPIQESLSSMLTILSSLMNTMSKITTTIGFIYMIVSGLMFIVGIEPERKVKAKSGVMGGFAMVILSFIIPKIFSFLI